jgi:hypothetical protein
MAFFKLYIKTELINTQCNRNIGKLLWVNMNKQAIF